MLLADVVAGEDIGAGALRVEALAPAVTKGSRGSGSLRSSVSRISKLNIQPLSAKHSPSSVRT